MVEYQNGLPPGSRGNRRTPMTEEVLLTKEGYEKIVAEYDDLVSVKRAEVAARIKEAREFGDISENAEYDAAKNEQAELEERINKLENMMRKAKIIEEGKTNRSKVNIGSKVTVKDTKTKKTEDYIIVGSTEADPFEGKISNESKVGEALIGHKVGEKVQIEVPSGLIEYEVISINK
jgi:transcription elongation factor GreA